MKLNTLIATALLSLVIPACPNWANAQAIVADHGCVAHFETIPTNVITEIATNYRFYYAHTSHGSQLVTGMDMLETENPTYARPYLFEVSDDLGTGGDLSWEYAMRFHLTDHPEVNVAMISWCGGVSSNTEEGINIYLNAYDQMEQDFPAVTFVYMTGHLDGSGDDGNLRQRNNQIRQFCRDNGKVLFDFADIESYDPDGIRYPAGTDACEWCYDWCAVQTCPSCGGCAHSHCFNCYLKGKAFWWMMARVTGWTPGSGDECCEDRVGDANLSGDDEPTIGDINTLIDHLYINQNPLLCWDEGDINQSGDITIGDISILIDYIYILGPEEVVLLDCPARD